MSRHTTSVAPDEIDAYKEVASYKWTTTYVCKKCGNIKFYEGRTPFSRRCTKCKDEESVAAGTVFDKLRMPMGVSLMIIKEIMEETYLPHELESPALIRELTGVLLNKRTLVNFIRKVYSVMTTPFPVCKTSLAIAVFYHGQQRMMVAVGTIEGDSFYHGSPINNNKSGDETVKQFARLHTNAASKVRAIDLKGYYLKRVRIINYPLGITRPALDVDLNEMKSLVRLAVNYIYDVKGKKIFQRYFDFFSYYNNGYDLSDLMNRLTKDYSKYSISPNKGHLTSF